MRIVLCDDHPVFRDGMRLLLTELGHEVVAEAATGEEAIERAVPGATDIVVMDLHLPGISGVEAIQAIARADPTIGILVLTMLDDDATLIAALRAGARGYLLKGAGHADVTRALTAVANGDIVIGATAAHGLANGLSAVGTATAFPQLTRRELEILGLLARGRTNEQIAAALFLSTKTIRNNVSAIMSKLNTRTRAETVARARDAGLGRPSPPTPAPDAPATTERPNKPIRSPHR